MESQDLLVLVGLSVVVRDPLIEWQSQLNSQLLSDPLKVSLLKLLPCVILLMQPMRGLAFRAAKSHHTEL